MKSILILAFFLFAFSQASPIVPIIVSSPALAAPLLTKVEGQAPASTSHAVHTKVIPQVISYHATPIISSPLISSPVISAYSLPVYQ